MFRAIVAAGAIALALAAAGLAAGARPNPVKLALQRPDLPANIFPSADAQLLDHEDVADLGVSGLKAASYSYSWPAGGKAGGQSKTWYLYGYVFVAPGRAGAQKLYQRATRLRDGLPFVDLQYPPADRQTVLSLHPYGDEQLGIVGTGKGPEATLYVRRGAVVWGLSISHGPTAWNPTRAQVTAQLKLYAGKQAAHVRAG